MEERMLVCKGCNKPKQLSEFRKSKFLPSGRRQPCKACDNANAKTRRGAVAGKPPIPADEIPADVGLLRNMLRETQSQLKRSQAVHEIVLDAAKEILEPLRIPLSVRPYAIPKSQKSKDAEAQILHLSDLQIGKTTSTYNIERFAVEMDDTFETTVALAQICRSDHPVDELVIPLNGDLVEGEAIFPGQAWVSQVGVFKQAVMGAQILAEDIARVAHHWSRIRIVVTRGNHGRGGRDWCEASNWDLVLGKLLELHLKNVKNVSVEVSEDWYVVTEVKGKRIMQTHGDRIRSGGDTPFTAISKRTSLWRSSIPGNFDVLLIGHFHNYASFLWNGAWVMMNGSPESSNDYAQSYMGMASRPLQTVFFVHERRGVTYQTPIYLGRGLEDAA